MDIPAAFFRKVKWTIYAWIGAVSVSELSRNPRLAEKIEDLCRTLRAVPAG